MLSELRLLNTGTFFVKYPRVRFVVERWFYVCLFLFVFE